MQSSGVISPSPLATVDRLAELLRWYADMGVDAALDERAHNRFEEGEAPGPTFVRQAPPTQPAASPPPLRELAAPLRAPARPVAMAPSEAAVSALALASGARTLDELRAALEGFEGCALKPGATQLVFEDGARGAPLMLVGEAPGADEDRLGRPFVGRAGQLLDRMLAACGLDRTQVYIANVVPWRPPGNRAPTPQETSACLPFMQRQIELAAPKLLVCLGGSAAATLLNLNEGIMRARGRWYDYDCNGRVIKTMAMLHPAYLLRQPLQKRLAWKDWREVMRAMG